jgi:hypothetical protein
MQLHDIRQRTAGHYKKNEWKCYARNNYYTWRTFMTNEQTQSNFVQLALVSYARLEICLHSWDEKLETRNLSHERGDNYKTTSHSAVLWCLFISFNLSNCCQMFKQVQIWSVQAEIINYFVSRISMFDSIELRWTTWRFIKLKKHDSSSDTENVLRLVQIKFVS